MAPRPYWKGYLKLSLVSCAVALYPAASRSERISFHWLNRETGNRLKQLMVDSETGEPVERDERVRGYQLAKNDYLMIEEDELDSVEIESSHTIEIEKFVPAREVDPVFLENSYYLAPDDRVAEEAFCVIREAMKEEGVAGIGRAVIARRERLMLLQPRGKGMLSTVLHYANEVRGDQAYFEGIRDIKVSEEMLQLAKHIIRTKIGHFDIGQFEDRYENALAELIRAKQAGRPPPEHRPVEVGNVVNLMEALRRSIEAERREAPEREERKVRKVAAEAQGPPRRSASKPPSSRDDESEEPKPPSKRAGRAKPPPEEEPPAPRRRARR